jgi:hypothetical protein
VEIEIGSKQLDHLVEVCDNADLLLRKSAEGSEDPESLQLANAVAKLSLVVIECRQVINLVSADLACLKAELVCRTSDLESANTSLGILKLQYQAHRGMLEKIVRMKGAGRNIEAAMAAESFLAQNPAV